MALILKIIFFFELSSMKKKFITKYVLLSKVQNSKEIC